MSLFGLFILIAFKSLKILPCHSVKPILLQARLQEQLMVEKESRLLEMAARQEAERDSTIQRVTKSSASSLSSSLSSLSLGSTLSGKVLGLAIKFFNIT